MPESPLAAIAVTVHGRVQGVFFRDSCQQEAHDVGASGWITNQVDGTVSAVFEGTREAVDHMVQWARAGPPHADVDSVETAPVDPRGLTSFAVR